MRDAEVQYTFMKLESRCLTCNAHLADLLSGSLAWARHGGADVPLDGPPRRYGGTSRPCSRYRRGRQRTDVWMRRHRGRARRRAAHRCIHHAVDEGRPRDPSVRVGETSADVPHVHTMPLPAHALRLAAHSTWRQQKETSEYA